MSRHGGHGIIEFVIGGILAAVLQMCEWVIPPSSVVVEPSAEAAECRMYQVPVYDDPVDGGVGECTIVDVWSEP